MSSVTEAKADQGYDPKPVWPECRNCKHLALTVTTADWGARYEHLVCTIGDFSPKKTATCKRHEFATTEKHP